MLNTLLIWVVLSYLFVAGVWYALLEIGAVVLNTPQDHYTRTLWWKVKTSVGWMYYVVGLHLFKLKAKRHLDCVKLQATQEGCVKQIVMRHGRMKNIASESDLQEGDRIYQFIHSNWKHGYTVSEGIVTGESTTWVVGHIDPNAPCGLESGIAGWQRISPVVHQYLKHKLANVR